VEKDHNKDIHHIHDKSYKFLMSNKRVFIELLRSFVDRGWVRQIDESNLTQLDKSYILQDFREQEADLVYQMQFKDRKIIFYVLMEMQSSVDFQMPYRLLLYMVEIWRDSLRNISSNESARKDFKLPVIVPIVLYNGAGPWTVCRSFRETLDHQEWFGDEVLDFKYILVNVRDYSDDELLELSNLVGAVFLLEGKQGIHAFMAQMEQLTHVFEKLPYDMFSIWLTWIKLVTHRGLSDEHKQRIDQIVDQYTEPKEAGNMISNLEKLFENFEYDAEQKGVTQGVAQGMELAAQRMLEKGMDISTIVEVTGLTKEKIENIRK